MLNIADLTGLQFECECGKTHTIHTYGARVGKGALSSLARDMERVSPVGAQIALIYQKSALNQARSVEKELMRAGYRVWLFLPQDLDMEKEQYYSVLVGVGGGRLCDFVKLKAKKYQKKVFLLPLTLSGVGTNYGIRREKTGFICQKSCAAPDCIILDYNLLSSEKQKFAAGFGEGVSRLFSVLDNRIISCLKGERFCQRSYNDVKNEVFSLVSSLKNMDRRDKVVGQIIAETNTVLSLLDQQTEGTVYGGGEVAAALCSEMLARREKREPLSFGEEAFLYAKVLIEFYKEALFFNNKIFLPPPNNNRRAEMIGEYLGIDEVYSYKHQSPLLDVKSLELMNYRLRIYSEEIKRELSEAGELFKEAERIFYRLYDDDGFSVSGVRDEGSLCVALAPDVNDRITCLDYFKATGLLDSLLY